MQDDRDGTDKTLERIDKVYEAREQVREDDAKIRQAEYLAFLRDYQTLRARVIIPTLDQFCRKPSRAVTFELEENELNPIFRIMFAGALHTKIAFSADTDRRQVKVVISTASGDRKMKTTEWYWELGELMDWWVRRVVDNALEEIEAILLAE